MKHIIILGDGMADEPIAELGGLTPLQYAPTPAMDRLAKLGASGRLHTVPDGFHPGSEVANLSILGYDLPTVYDGRVKSQRVLHDAAEIALRHIVAKEGAGHVEGDLVKGHALHPVDERAVERGDTFGHE
ncbi:hypothetical protein T235_03580 [Tannerella sp. oral taxon BU063 isolate Cell 8/11]|uniref:Metalloenzyme domain-containing protein n=1 Tax=Tannerella sp. oral taxon BU063 isolate Cell 8/11 TaxID=1411915 RepID=W2D1U0_9BACT|nr:hypothetical protein T235_03580 [Tannerella sp. oral taxon BU063 isolate Cell 8/11]